MTVLLVDDDPALCDTLVLALKKRGYDASSCTSATESLERVVRGDFEVVVTDLAMKEMDGIALCERVHAARPDLPVVVLTAFGSLDSAVAAIRAGAYDFISKPVAIDALTIAIDRAAKHKALGDEVKRLRNAVEAPRFETLIGESAPMRAVHDLLARVADSEATVLLTGESGTGKEVAARAIHARSRRARSRFVGVNCAAVPEALLESELFGHAKGAFTGALAAREGLFIEAHGGTLLLDEIGDMPLALQPKLLRVLEERVVRPVGGKSEVPIDVRILATTNRDLESAVEEKRFREDLFFRINVIAIAMPPLRARLGDVLPLAQHFLLEFAGRAGKDVRTIAPSAAEKLASYSWPGNVRELRNAVERAVALARFDTVTVDDLPDKVRAYAPSHVIVAGEDPSELVPMEEVERRYVARVMQACAGNKTAAARVLGMDRKRLYRWLARLGLGE